MYRLPFYVFYWRNEIHRQIIPVRFVPFKATAALKARFRIFIHFLERYFSKFLNEDNITAFTVE
jgi:hypothetical protein